MIDGKQKKMRDRCESNYKKVNEKELELKNELDVKGQEKEMTIFQKRKLIATRFSR